MQFSLYFLVLISISSCCHVTVINRCAFDIRAKEKVLSTGQRAAIGFDTIGFYVKNATNEKVIGKIRRDTMTNKVFNATVILGGGASLVLGTIRPPTLQNAVVVLSDGVSGSIGNDGKNTTMTSVCCRESASCLYDYVYPPAGNAELVVAFCHLAEPYNIYLRYVTLGPFYVC